MLIKKKNYCAPVCNNCCLLVKGYSLKEDVITLVLVSLVSCHDFAYNLYSCSLWLVEILDEAEFGKAAANAEYDENNIHPASELGLLVSALGNKFRIQKHILEKQKCLHMGYQYGYLINRKRRTMYRFFFFSFRLIYP